MEYLLSYRDQLQNGIDPSWRDELYHHGIKGQKWGVRRPRNEDGIIAGAGAELARKQRAAQARANDYRKSAKSSLADAARKSRSAEMHATSARTSGNLIDKAGHRFAQLRDNMAANSLRGKAKISTIKSAKEQLNADRLRARQEFEDWGRKADAKYAKDKRYRDKLGPDAERAVDRFNAANAKAKRNYKRTVYADKIASANRTADAYQRAANRDASMRKILRKQNIGVRAFTAPVAGAAAVSQHLKQFVADRYRNRARRLSN